ncbi:MAG: pseudaminic acid biosynthesis-associated methylase [Planctomycetota bacterium]|jgi:pseudaminic acid biosynthesis-associated methylase
MKIQKNTEEINEWMGAFGNDYTNRNARTINELNALYISNYGITRTKLNEVFIGDMDRNIKILEVGSNLGIQLALLQKTGFENLYGIEINSYAVERSKATTENINIVQGSAFDIPFKDGYFDIVFTSGLLIHISPSDIQEVLKEIYRCSNKYIWGFEYYADTYTEVMYRGHSSLLWKANFAGLYLDSFDGLEVVKEKRMKYLENENVDTMFLIKKRDRR